MTDNQLIGSGIIKHPFVVSSALLDQMAKPNQACHTREDKAIFAFLAMIEEMIRKD